MRGVAVLIAVLVLCGGCSRSNKNKESRVETKDDAGVEVEHGAIVGPFTDKEVLELFHTAAACALPCKALEDLRALAKTSPSQVAAVALEIMADPLSRTDQRAGAMSMVFISDWLKSGPDEEQRRHASKALQRVTAEGSSHMRTAAYVYLGEHRLPGAREFLLAEIENPARDESARGAAAAALGYVLDGDFSLVRRWLADDHPHHWEAALEMLDSFDDFNAGNEALWSEVRGLLIALGKRPDLPGIVVYELARWYGYYLEEDPGNAEILDLVKRWSKHPDEAPAEKMLDLLP